MTKEDLIKSINGFRRVAICGYPHTGKTTIANESRQQAIEDNAGFDVCARTVIHTDDYMKLPWSEASQAVVDVVNGYASPVLVEGMAVPRALRKGMNVDYIIWLDVPFNQLTPDQEKMGKGALTILTEYAAANPSALIAKVVLQEVIDKYGN